VVSEGDRVIVSRGVACLLASVLVLVGAVAAAATTDKTAPAPEHVETRVIRAAAMRGQHHPSVYWELERKYVKQQHALGRANAEVRRLRRVNARWQKARTLQQSGASVGGSQLERDFLCIHSFEGAWDDPDAPYWGGLQMDREFMASYGPEFVRAWGTADHWPVSVQIAVAIRAYLSGRGFHPWPNTSRACGL
jgi:hypothetical protein